MYKTSWTYSTYLINGKQEKESGSGVGVLFDTTPLHYQLSFNSLKFVNDLLTLSAMAGFQTHISKCSKRGVKLNFLIFFHMGIRNKKV